jgi:uracil-DNA glycosylase family 4
VLERRVTQCTRCPRLVAYRERIAREKRRAYAAETYWGRPVPAFGDPLARLVIVGLAPGAHGSNRTGRMFTGDASGDWLYAALHRYGFASRAVATSRTDGLTLLDCWITAAARCAPPGNKPTPRELANCRPWLARELELLTRRRVVLALGRVGHDAFLKISGWHARFAHGAVTRLPDGTWLVASYHPSRQNTNTGKLTRAMWHSVFRRVRALVDRG